MLSDRIKQELSHFSGNFQRESRTGEGATLFGAWPEHCHEKGCPAKSKDVSGWKHYSGRMFHEGNIPMDLVSQVVDDIIETGEGTEGRSLDSMVGFRLGDP